MDEQRFAQQPRGHESRINLNPQSQQQRLAQRLRLDEINEVLDALNPIAHKVFNLLALIGCMVVLGLILGEKFHLLHDAVKATEFELIKAY